MASYFYRLDIQKTKKGEGMVSRSTRMDAAAAVGTENSTLTTAAGEKGVTIDYSALRPHKAITVDHVNRVLGVGTYTDEELKKTRDEWKVEKCDC